MTTKKSKESYGRREARQKIWQLLCFNKQGLMIRAKLPKGLIIHHVDEDPTNNSNANLVVCQDQSYHILLHFRADRLRGGNTRKRFVYQYCYLCGKFEHKSRLIQFENKAFYCHQNCLEERLYKRKEEVGKGT